MYGPTPSGVSEKLGSALRHVATSPTDGGVEVGVGYSKQTAQLHEMKTYLKYIGDELRTR